MFLLRVQAESNPDNILAMGRLQGEVIAFGSQTIQFFSDQALIPEIYESVQAATQEYGLAAIYAIAPFQNSLAFLGQNRQGTVQVMLLEWIYPYSDQHSRY